MVWNCGLQLGIRGSSGKAPTHPASGFDYIKYYGFTNYADHMVQMAAAIDWLKKMAINGTRNYRNLAGDAKLSLWAAV